MDRAMLLEHLKATERHVARGREHIAHQRELTVMLLAKALANAKPIAKNP
jgi:hypothetical protein